MGGVRDASGVLPYHGPAVSAPLGFQENVVHDDGVDAVDEEVPHVFVIDVSEADEVEPTRDDPVEDFGKLAIKILVA